MQEYNKEAFAKLLKAFRKSSGMTQDTVAAALSINRSTYAYYETGKTSPDPAMLCRLAAMFQLTVDQLLGNQPPLAADLRDGDLLLDEEERLRLAQLTAEEQVLILQYRQLQDTQKQEIRERIREDLNDE